MPAIVCICMHKYNLSSPIIFPAQKATKTGNVLATNIVIKEEIDNKKKKINLCKDKNNRWLEKKNREINFHDRNWNFMKT